MANVLVADDAIFLRGMVRRMLEAHGHTVIAEAANGKEAVDQFRLTKPDVVLLDITMPDMDGIEAMRYIRSIDPQAKVVVCTALVHQKMIETAIESGVDGFIVKPFDEEKLVKTIEKLCESNDAPVMVPQSDMDLEIEEVENFFIEEAVEEAEVPETMEYAEVAEKAEVPEAMEYVEVEEETEVPEAMEYVEVEEEAEVPEAMEYVEVEETAEEPETMEYVEVVEEAEVPETMEYVEVVEEAEEPETMEYVEVEETVEVPEAMEYTEVVEEAEESETMEYVEVEETAEVPETMEYVEVVETAEVPETMEYTEVAEEKEEPEAMEYAAAKAKERERDLAEVAQKTMSRKTYMKKWRNLTDQEVEEELQQISYEMSLIERIGG